MHKQPSCGCVFNSIVKVKLKQRLALFEAEKVTKILSTCNLISLITITALRYSIGLLRLWESTEFSNEVCEFSFHTRSQQHNDLN
jgi:hypothetical protein